MSKFKVGELVRIVDIGGGVPSEMLGKILPITEEYYGIYYIKDLCDETVWAFCDKRLQHVNAINIHKGSSQHQGKFVMPDGTPGTVDVHIRGNVTQVTIIVDPQEEYHACNQGKQFYSGFAFCNPCDKFDINTGIKEACKKALSTIQIDWGDDWRYDLFGYQRSIYSSIRKAMRGEK